MRLALRKRLGKPDSNIKQPLKIISNECGYGFTISRRGAPEFCEERFALLRRGRAERRTHGASSSLMRIKNKRTS